ncbi:MAG TPA: IS630 family transposase, partial [Chthonomonadales bacterium]|nr:IS630 family transposase [Chthonomonadales bacterium]
MERHVRLAEALGDVSSHQAWRILRQRRIPLHRRSSWCVITDPGLAAKAAVIVGLCLDPPESASEAMGLAPVVLCGYERPEVQALERAQGACLKLPGRRALTGLSHESKRHVASTLFAALVVATEQVLAGYDQHRRRVEFLDPMGEVIAHHPGREMQVILFTHTHASRPNLDEAWFRLLS